ncbi:MAG: hypothetical protein IJ567_08090 [Lachnospiraceae bacterium]|nr:hypothetical protein [Lachnospiraceae bacterium]
MSEAHFKMASDDLAGDAKRRVPIPEPVSSKMRSIFERVLWGKSYK